MTAPGVKFFSTTAHACSYLPGEQAVTLFADPKSRMDRRLYTDLSDLGFRRSGNYVYRPHCSGCNACVAACPEGAIGLDYQVNLDACRSHRDCVKACGVAGAIDFTREPVAHSDAFDLVLDLRPQPAFLQHAKPQGYLHLAPGQETGAPALEAVLKLRELVGEFEKPRFFAYKQKLCAHSRNEKVGCNACVDICSAEAIASDKSRQQVRVEPALCVGCGACTTVCPTGAMTYAYPRAADQGAKLRTLLAIYERAGGSAPVLLLHSQERGQALVEEAGRAARVGAGAGVPANVIPLALWHVASVGIDLWLTAVAQGAAHVAVLATDEEAPQYLDALEAQPLYNAISQIVYATGRHQVGDVWIAGVRKVENGALCAIDTDALRAKTQAWRARIAAN